MRDGRLVLSPFPLHAMHAGIVFGLLCFPDYSWPEISAMAGF
jgi:hypothetical protein